MTLVSLGMMVAFAANAAPTDSFKFTVVGDTQTDGAGSSLNWEIFPGLIESMNDHGPVYMLVAGDLVGGAYTHSAVQEQWADFNLAIEEFNGDTYMVPGNHDVYSGSGVFNAWRDTFPWLPTDDSPDGEGGVSYYLDHGNTRFIFITSDGPSQYGYVSTEGLKWLDRVLSESAGIEHTFVVTHHPVSFGDNYHGGTSGDFWQLMVGYGVTGVFGGHWHRYQPSQLGGGADTWETIIGTGGGWQGFEPIRPYQQIPGFLLVEVNDGQADATFYGDEDGDGDYDDALDSYTMAWAGEVPHGLRGRYTFDDGTAADSSSSELGAEVHGVFLGDAEVVKGGVSGSALTVDGSADAVEAGSIGDYVLAIKNDLTLSVWVKPESVQSGDYGSTIITYATNDYYGEDEETNYSYWLSLRTNGNLVAYWEHGLGNNVFMESTASASLMDGDWHHLALVREADAKIVRFYVDGEQLGEEVPFENLPTGGGRGMLYLGSDTVASGYEFTGGIDEVCIFDLALDAKAIGNLVGLADCAKFAESTPVETGDTGTMKETGDTQSTTDTGETQGTSETGDSSGGDTDGTTDNNGAETESSSGCGCGTASTMSIWWLTMFPFLMLFRRRERV